MGHAAQSANWPFGKCFQQAPLCSTSATPAGGLGGQLPLGADRGGPEGEGLAQPYPPGRRTQPPLSERQKSANTARSKVRARVEHVFGHQQNSMGGKIVRTIEIVRANIRGLVQLKRMGAAPA
jgi:hypothetical protein